MSLFDHPLFKTIRELKGNSRYSVLTEPMFGIPFNLFNPYRSVFMLALGMNDAQIGTLISLGAIIEIFAAFISGAIVDKYGRRFTLFIADLLCWVVPTIIWAFAQDIKYFVIAIIFNSTWRLSHTAWTCLTVEDAEERHIVHIWTWISIFIMATAFFAPIGGWFVAKYGTVTAVRGFYLFGFFMLLAKVLILYFKSTETARGVIRMEETKNTSIFTLLGEYKGVFKQVLESKQIHAGLALLAVTNIFQTVNGSFWSVLFTSKLGFTNSEIAIYATLRSVVMTTAFFVLGPRFSNPRKFKKPLWLGYGLLFGSQLLLVLMPAHHVWLVVLSVIFEAFGAALINPMSESIMALSLESKDRARVSALVYTALIFIISPFGWIAGQLSTIDRALPFTLNMALFAIGAVLVWIISRPGFIPTPPKPAEVSA